MSRLDGWSGRGQRRLVPRNGDPRTPSNGEDLRYPTTTGIRVTAVVRLQQRYLDRVVDAATRDLVLADAFVRMLGMRTCPTPRILAAAAGPRRHGLATVPPPHAPSTRSPRAEAEPAARHTRRHRHDLSCG